MKTFLFNPYTGTPRHPSDIASDPEGILIVEPDAPLLAATQPAAEPVDFASAFDATQMEASQEIAKWPKEVQEQMRQSATLEFPRPSGLEASGKRPKHEQHEQPEHPTAKPGRVRAAEFPIVAEARAAAKAQLAFFNRMYEASGKRPKPQQPTEALFEFLAHGDEAHQAWLRQAIAAFFAGEPRPELVMSAAPQPPKPVADRAAWWALAMSAAASLEDASNCLRDADAKASALGAAEHVREQCNAMWFAAPQPAAEPVAHWVVRRYGSLDLKGYNIYALPYPWATHGEHIANLGDGEAACIAAESICAAHNRAEDSAATQHVERAPKLTDEQIVSIKDAVYRWRENYGDADALDEALRSIGGSHAD